MQKRHAGGPIKCRRHALKMNGGFGSPSTLFCIHHIHVVAAQVLAKTLRIHTKTRLTRSEFTTRLRVLAGRESYRLTIKQRAMRIQVRDIKTS